METVNEELLQRGHTAGDGEPPADAGDFDQFGGAERGEAEARKEARAVRLRLHQQGEKLSRFCGEFVVQPHQLVVPRAASEP